VAAYLRATQLSVDRQVILEAKIIQVDLSNASQSGINWSAISGNSHISGGFISQGGSTQTGETLSLTNAGLTATTTSAGSLAAATNGTGSLFGLALQTKNFSGLISFLESQGNVHVLSSPRIATLNNQKAVLKVGTDSFFVTNVSSNINTSVTGTISTPNVTLQPFFSGVVLDVTPQIDDKGNIILHIHPAVSDVQTANTTINLGAQGSLVLPLAQSTTSETDSVVRAQDGNIIAIGGLMKQSTSADRSQIPGAGDVPVVGNLFRNTSQTTTKSELVILLKPTVIQNDGSWSQDMLDTQRRLQTMAPRDRPQE
jgi:MSHA biogenesis protein MshL